MIDVVMALKLGYSFATGSTATSLAVRTGGVVSMAEIDAEIAAARRDRHSKRGPGRS